MSTSTLGFRVSKTQKEFINKVVKTVMDKFNLSKPDAFEKIIESYDKEILAKGTTQTDAFIPPNVMDAIRSIECDYLQFVEDTFYCLEKFNKSKKKDMLGVEPLEILSLCTSCKKGKADMVRKEIDKERRKESMKKLMAFAKQFMIVTERGFLATSYMCKCESLEGRFIFSRDGKTLYCALEDGDAVSIPETCMLSINPDTGKTPCQYLITLEHLSNITKEDMEKMNLVIPNLDIVYEEPIVDIEKLNPVEPRRIIESETAIEGEIPSLCPDCEDVEMSEDDKGKYCHKCGYREDNKE